MLKRFIRLVGGDPNKREIEKISEIVDQIQQPRTTVRIIER